MTPSLAELVGRARARAGKPRAILGIAGAPGAGKTTLAGQLGAALDAPVVGMDGFHLRNAELRRRGLLDRKGAPETFDAVGYVGLLRALRSGGSVTAPVFDRSIEEPLEDALTVAAADRLVITEGNYLLLDSGAWAPVRELLDECWFVEAVEPLRQERLIDRHVWFGWPRDEAVERVLTGSDAVNAVLVASTAPRADLIVTVTGA